MSEDDAITKAANLPATVQIAGVPVLLGEPDDRWRFIIRRGGWSNIGLMSAACLGVCWRSPGRPGESANPRQVDAYGDAIVTELFRRGATFEEIDHATDVAFLILRGAVAPTPDVQEVADTADFSEAPDGSPATS